MQFQKEYKRIVIKIGSSLLCSDGSKVDSCLIERIVSQVSDLVKLGKEVVLVSSGAIALGMSALKTNSRPKELAGLQAAAALGQPELMDIYRKFFSLRQIGCAQLLLTWEDFAGRLRYLNAKNTLLKLLELKCVPVINENDTVSTEEIKFGDNDRLSALVANLISADMLIILSDVAGLLDKDKLTVIRVVDQIDARIKSLACPSEKKACVGGMITKIEAARITMDSGIPCVIASGKEKEIILSIVKEPGKQGTLFIPKKALAAKDRWMAFSAKLKGKVVVDDGARLALINKKSLLSVGVLDCEGDFTAGDIVSLRDRKGHEFARGKAGFSCKELSKIKGSRAAREIMHRDNIVILSEA